MQIESAPERRSSARLARSRWRSLLVVGPAIVVLVLGAATLDGVHRAAESRASIAHTREVIEGAQSMFSALQDAETGQRGYVITGDTKFLEPYDHGVASLRTDTTILGTLTRDNSAQHARLDSLDRLIQARVTSLATGVITRRTIGFDSAARATRSSRGNALMDSIRVIVGEVIATERGLLERRQAADARRERIVTLILVAGTAAAVVLALVLNGILLRSAVVESRLAREIESRNKQLEDQSLELELQSQQLQEQASELETQNEELQTSGDTLAEQATELETQARQLEATIRALDDANQAAEIAREAA